jgi:hypothetical protein
LNILAQQMYRFPVHDYHVQWQVHHVDQQPTDFNSLFILWLN